MTINEVCKKFGVTRKFLRFYEEKGFITPSRKGHGQLDYRDYDDADLLTIRNIVYFRKLGLSGREIMTIFKSSDYDPEKPSACAMRFIEKKTQNLIEMIGDGSVT